MNQSYLCIDLKSYYASVECVDRGLDPFTANLVVADETRGMGALCLAVSPALKALASGTAVASSKSRAVSPTSSHRRGCSTTWTFLPASTRSI